MANDARVPADPPRFDLDAAWALHPQVAVRPEPFGALLYHFGSRRLSFLKDRSVHDIVVSLAAHPSARSACVASSPAHGEPSSEVVTALATLADTGMIEARDLNTGSDR